jgi:hypothetical protein
MALKANKPVGNTAPQATQAATQTEPTSVPAGNVEQHTPAANAPAVQQQRAVVPAGALANLNAGILEGIDDLGGTGNYVTVDGTNLLYKASNEEATHIDMVIHYGKRFYQWVDETDPQSKKFHNADTKLDSRYKLKFEIKWYEDRGDEEPTEFTHTCSTTSAMNFIEYVKALAAKGLGVNQVVTRVTASRQVSQDGKNRYSRAEFEAFDLEQYNEGQLATLGVKTPNAKQGL